MKKLLLGLTLLTSMSAFAGNDIIMEYNGATIVPEVHNGIFYNLDDKGQCIKTTRHDKSEFGSSKIKSEEVVEIQDCKAELIAKNIEAKIKKSGLNCPIQSFSVGPYGKTLKKEGSSENTFFKSATTLREEQIFGDDCFCKHTFRTTKWVSNLENVTLHPLRTLFNGPTTEKLSRVSLLDVDSCLDLVNDNAELSQAIAESYREIEEKLGE